MASITQPRFSHFSSIYITEETDVPGRIAQDLSGLLTTQCNMSDSKPFSVTVERGSDFQDAAPEYPPQQTVPLKQDILVACAAHPGMISFVFQDMHYMYISGLLDSFCNVSLRLT